MRIVVALGGNALLRRGEAPEAPALRDNVGRAADAIAEIATGNELVVTHGNGPQIGLLALQAEAYDAISPYPLDILGAVGEGMIGYLIDRELRSRLADRDIATLLTQVEVDPSDPASQYRANRSVPSMTKRRPKNSQPSGTGPSRRTVRGFAVWSPRPDRPVSSKSRPYGCCWKPAYWSSAPAVAAYRYPFRLMVR